MALYDQEYYFVKHIGYSEKSFWKMPVYRRLYILNKYKKELQEQADAMEKAKKGKK
jgi:hypothetical protein